MTGEGLSSQEYTPNIVQIVLRLIKSWFIQKKFHRGHGCLFVCCECFVLSGRGLCDELITRPEDSYRLWCVVVCDLENLMNEEPYPINVIEFNIGDTSLDVFPTCR